MDSIKPNATNAALLIDEMILDYLVCLTTSNILKEGAARTAGQGAQNSEELLGLFDC